MTALRHPGCRGDGPRHSRHADYHSTAISDWRKGGRDVKQTAILSPADGIDMRDMLAASNLLLQAEYFIDAIRRSEDSDGLPDDLECTIAIRVCRTGIPTLDLSGKACRSRGVAGSTLDPLATHRALGAGLLGVVQAVCDMAELLRPAGSGRVGEMGKPSVIRTSRVVRRGNRTTSHDTRTWPDHGLATMSSGIRR
jgi:hypothetical protein